MRAGVERVMPCSGKLKKNVIGGGAKLLLMSDRKAMPQVRGRERAVVRGSEGGFMQEPWRKREANRERERERDPPPCPCGTKWSDRMSTGGCLV